MNDHVEIAIKWFEDNKMIVNPDKFQAIIINMHGNYDPINQHHLNLNQYKITSKNSVTLLGFGSD